jgi:hypothetical protein
VKVQLGSVAPETSSHWKLSIDHNAGASFQSASENECNTNSRVNVSDDSSERSLLPLSDFQKWMTFPRMISPLVFCYVVFFKMCLTGTVDEIAVSTGHALHGNGLISPSNLRQLLPSCCLWRLELPGTWQAITDSNSSPSTLTAYDVLCATGGSPPVNYLPSTCTQLHTIPDSLASAVDTAFLHNPLAQMPLPEPAKSQPTLSAMKLFGSPVRSSQSQLSQPQVRFMDTKMHSDISRPQSQIHSDHRRSYVPPTRGIKAKQFISLKRRLSNTIESLRAQMLFVCHGKYSLQKIQRLSVLTLATLVAPIALIVTGSWGPTLAAS